MLDEWTEIGLLRLTHINGTRDGRNFILINQMLHTESIGS